MALLLPVLSSSETEGEAAESDGDGGTELPFPRRYAPSLASERMFGGGG